MRSRFFVGLAVFFFAGSAVGEVLYKVVGETPEESPQFRDRFLDLAQARLIHSPLSRKDVVQMLESKKSIFDSEDCPPAQRQRFTDLLRGN